MATNVTDLAALQAQVKELTEALQARTRANAELQERLNTRLNEEAEKLAAQRFEQQQALEQDAAERAKSKVLRRPASYAEYKALTLADRAKALEMFGQDMVAELLDKSRRDAKAAAWTQIEDKLARQRAIHPGRRF